MKRLTVLLCLMGAFTGILTGCRTGHSPVANTNEGGTMVRDPDERLAVRWSFDERGEVGTDVRGLVDLDGKAANWVEERERGGVIRMDANCHSLHGGDTKLLDGLDTVTFVGWVKLLSIPANRMMIVSKDNAYEWFLNGRGATMNFRINNQAYDSVEVFLETNRWYHLAVAASPDGKVYYVNGEHVGTAGSAELIKDSTNTLAVGGRASTEPDDRFFGVHGFIDDVSIYDRQLAENQIRHLLRTTRKKVRSRSLRLNKPKADVPLKELAGDYHGFPCEGIGTKVVIGEDGTWQLASAAVNVGGSLHVKENRVTLELAKPTPAKRGGSRALVAMQFARAGDTLRMTKIRDLRGRETFVADKSFPNFFQFPEWCVLKKHWKKPGQPKDVEVERVEAADEAPAEAKPQAHDDTLLLCKKLVADSCPKELHVTVFKVLDQKRKRSTTTVSAEFQCESPDLRGIYKLISVLDARDGVDARMTAIGHNKKTGAVRAKIKLSARLPADG